jgi:polysaccharide biosynthesis protein PslG
MRTRCTLPDSTGFNDRPSIDRASLPVKQNSTCVDRVRTAHPTLANSPPRMSLAWVFIAPALLVCVMFSAPARSADGFTTGICAHLINRPAVAARSLPYLDKLGVASVRSDAPWAKVERQRDELQIPAEWDQFVDTLLQHGIQPLLILDYGNRYYDQGDKPTSPEAINAFVRYASFVVQHFRGRVRFYEVWNEWDAATGHTTPGTPESYTKLLRNVYPALKAQDPNSIVLGGSVTSEALRGDRQLRLLSALGLQQSWFQRLLATQALKYMDGLSVHPYNFMLSGDQTTAAAWFAWIQRIESELRLANSNRDVPLYVTEMGWPAYSGPGGISDTATASNLAQSFALARTVPYVKGIWWYQLQDEQWDPADKEHHFGLLQPDFSVKPAFRSWPVPRPRQHAIGPDRL